jgi:hypothetical protein
VTFCLIVFFPCLICLSFLVLAKESGHVRRCAQWHIASVFEKGGHGLGLDLRAGIRVRARVRVRGSVRVWV